MEPQPSLHSDDCGLHLVQHVHLPVAACQYLLLSVGVWLCLGQQVADLSRGHSSDSSLLCADGGIAGFSDGGTVVVEVVVGDRCF